MDHQLLVHLSFECFSEYLAFFSIQVAFFCLSLEELSMVSQPRHFLDLLIFVKLAEYFVFDLTEHVPFCVLKIWVCIGKSV
jgi:hypothetical protein